MRQKRKTDATKTAMRLGADLPAWVEQHVQKPAKELADVAPIWASLVPADAQRACRLVSCKRGVLKVAVGNTVARAHVDALLRGGLLAAIKKQCPKVWKVKVTVVAEGDEE